MWRFLCKLLTQQRLMTFTPSMGRFHKLETTAEAFSPYTLSHCLIHRNYKLPHNNCIRYVCVACQTSLCWNLSKSGRPSQTEHNLNNTVTLKYGQDTAFGWQLYCFFFLFVISTTQNWTLAYALHAIGKCKLVLFIRRWMRPGWWFMQHGRKLPNFPTLSSLRNYSLTLSIQHTVHNAHKYLQAATLPKPCQQQIKFVFF